MDKYHLSRKAAEDLENIWRYTFETWSEKQADNYYQQLIAGFEEIAFEPGRGRPYEKIETGLKGYLIGKHIIFYFAEKGKVTIVRILHEKMDLKHHLD